ncbi:hypothetical protein ABKN59_007028 [Abortiporus biennis]
MAPVVRVLSPRHRAAKFGNHNASTLKLEFKTYPKAPDALKRYPDKVRSKFIAVSTHSFSVQLSDFELLC